MSQAQMFLDPPAGLVPPAGSVLVLTRGHDRLFVHESARHPGHYFVAAWFDAGPSRERGARRADRDATAEGFGRPVRGDAVLEAVAWLRWPSRSSGWDLLPAAPATTNPYLPPEREA
ncbi:MAG: hypothetical protein M9894_32590 [Planctomycetes bacterium]|nr:hypothetical protein [Planctomycetota bacterium]